jgi:hypothetical protein
MKKIKLLYYLLFLLLLSCNVTYINSAKYWTLEKEGELYNSINHYHLLDSFSVNSFICPIVKEFEEEFHYNNGFLSLKFTPRNDFVIIKYKGYFKKRKKFSAIITSSLSKYLNKISIKKLNKW